MFLQQLAHLLNSTMSVAAYRNSLLAYKNLEIMQGRVVEYSQIDSIGISGDKKGVH